ncbi:MAG TPA: aminodeoxychorismate synthase component I [Chthoniobacteraceae bacterium]|nr:aminodeoxychorismate synthase component I [Chthoniobacteraceae bacterium]
MKAPRPVALDAAPFEVALSLRRLPGLVFFDSALEGGAVSIVAARPSEVVAGSTARDWEALREKIALRQQAGAGGMDTGFPCGMAAGSVDYDGAFCFGFYDEALVYRHADQTWMAVGELDRHMAPPAPACGPIEKPAFVAEMGRAEYCAMVARAKEYIAAGDIYQVNLSRKFSAPWSGDALRFYGALRHYSPAPYAAYLDLGGRQVLSSSPELFLQMSGRAIRTRPIKGTRPRHADAAADARSEYDLLTSPKEIAELVMITDLERNDLGRVCEYGSVEAAELLKLERYEQVFHLVSTVRGRLRAGVGHVDALQSCFPGGSITGAPKKRAREIIAELEPVPRGLYTGAIGWFGFNGESQFNIAIRTVVVENGAAHFHTGAGIVADSDPGKEFEETQHKAAGILLAAERMGAKGD